MIKAVVMAGGSGTHLWHQSRAARPKQFLALHGDDTMLKATFKQLREIDKLGTISLEPVGRNTAPAIALAALSSPEGGVLCCWF
jgi:mannose-1-phosphate guanylyltransferase